MALGPHGVVVEPVGEVRDNGRGVDLRPGAPGVRRAHRRPRARAVRRMRGRGHAAAAPRAGQLAATTCWPTHAYRRGSSGTE